MAEIDEIKARIKQLELQAMPDDQLLAMLTEKGLLPKPKDEAVDRFVRAANQKAAPLLPITAYDVQMASFFSHADEIAKHRQWLAQQPQDGLDDFRAYLRSVNRLI